MHSYIVSRRQIKIAVIQTNRNEGLGTIQLDSYAHNTPGSYIGRVGMEVVSGGF